MSRFVWTTAAAALIFPGAVIAHQGEETGHARAAANADGRITADKTVHDFGEILDEKTVYAEFNIQNTGDSPLTIMKVDSSCGCTKPELVGFERGEKGEVNAVFQPGETGVVRVGFRPLGKKGDKTETVTLETSDPEQRKFTLSIKATVTPMVYVEPALLTFGLIEPEERVWTVKVTGYAPDFEALRLALGGEEGFSSKVVGTEDVETQFGPARQTTIEVRYTGDSEPGKIQGYGLIRTNDPKRRLTGIAYSGTVLGMITAEPKTVFQTTPVDKRAATPVTVRVRHMKGKPFKVEEVKIEQLSGPMPVTFETQEVEGSPGAYDVTLDMVAPFKSGPFNSKIYIKTDMPDEPELEVQYRGVVKQ